jgi:S-formylglutathione hydrolase FrmB
MFRAVASYSGVVHPLYGDFPRQLMYVVQRYGQEPVALWGDPVAQRDVWQAHDPYYLAKELRTIPVYMSSGDGRTDNLEALLNKMNHALAAQLEQAGVRVTTDFYSPGTHNWPYWQRELHRSLPMLLCAVGKCQPQGRRPR